MLATSSGASSSLIDVGSTGKVHDSVNDSVKIEKVKSSHSLIRTATFKHTSSQRTSISSDDNGDNRVITGKTPSGNNLYALDELVSECPISGAPQLKHAALPAGGVGGSEIGEQKCDRIRPFFDMRNYEDVSDSYLDDSNQKTCIIH